MRFVKAAACFCKLAFNGFLKTVGAMRLPGEQDDLQQSKLLTAENTVQLYVVGGEEVTLVLSCNICKCSQVFPDLTEKCRSLFVIF